MKFGINLYLWADDMHDGLMPVLERLKKIGYDGVEVPIFDLDQAKWAMWARRLGDLGLQCTANTVIAAEHNPLSPDPAVQEAAYEHHDLRAEVIDEPTFDWHQPRFCHYKDAECHLNRGATPMELLVYWVDEQCPAVLQVGNHHHADDAGQ